MAENKVFTRVAERIAEFREIDAASITGETTFEELGLDSLDTVELIMEFEEEFGVTIEVNENLKTIGDVVSLIGGLAQ